MSYPFGNFNNRAIEGRDGFAPPLMGGSVAVKYATITFADAGVATTLFTLPKGAVIVGITTDVTTAFNSSGTDLLDVGTSAAGDAYIADRSVASAGQTTTGVVASVLFTELTEQTTVTATYAQSVADADAGSVTIAIFYITK